MVLKPCFFLGIFEVASSLVPPWLPPWLVLGLLGSRDQKGAKKKAREEPGRKPGRSQGGSQGGQGEPKRVARKKESQAWPEEHQPLPPAAAAAASAAHAERPSPGAAAEPDRPASRRCMGADPTSSDRERLVAANDRSLEKGESFIFVLGEGIKR